VVIIVALWWLVAAHVVGAAVLPTLFRFFHPFSDRGFAFALPSGLLAFGLASWWLSVTGTATNSAMTSLLVLLVIAGLSWGSSKQTRADLATFWRRRRGLLLAEEGVFLASFLIFLWIRGYSSDINGTEKFMDFAFLNAVARSDTFPPIDPWLAPSPTMPDPRLNYYYFGYLCYGLLIQLTGVAPAEGFNLSLALVFAMVAVATFAFGYTVARDQVVTRFEGRKPDTCGTPLPAGEWAVGPATPFLLCGAATTFLTLIAGNLWTVLRRLDGSELWDRDFWSGIGWNATRVLVIKDGQRDIDYTINEFPVFSFLLGDLHPHVLTLPFAVVAIAVAYRWFLDPPYPIRFTLGRDLRGSGVEDPDQVSVPWRRLVARISPWASSVPVAALIGSLYFSNSWDYPTFLVTVICGGIAGALRWRNDASLSLLQTITRLTTFSVALSATALLLVGPFSFAFQPPVVSAAGELPIGLVSRRSDLSQFLSFWGLQLLWLLPALLVASLVVVGRDHARRVTMVAAGLGMSIVAIGLAETRSLGTYLLVVLIGAMAVSVASRLVQQRDGEATRIGGEASAFPFICLAIAMVLLAACEVVYIRDFYGGALRRMNTVFKLYFQAWLLIAVAAPQLAFWSLGTIIDSIGFRQRNGVPFFSGMTPVTAGRALVAWLVVVAGGMAVYPLHVVGLRTNHFSGAPVVNGMDWMRRFHPDDLAAATWLAENASKDTEVRAPVVLEAAGGPYSEFARIATQTGLPTVLGWDQHERLWRGESASAEVERRKQDVERFYRNGSGPEAREVLERYGVSYVVKGYLEERAYSGPGLNELDDPGSGLFEVFRSGNTVIYATGIPPRDRNAKPVAMLPVRNVR
jgi:YYY domain-containing protein